MKGKKLILEEISISIQKSVKQSLFKDTYNIKQTNLEYAFEIDFYLCTILKLENQLVGTIGKLQLHISI